MKRIVVTGTGTSIGKTHFTCALARSASKQRVAAFKPIETGVEPTGGETTDSGQLTAVSSFHVKRWLDPVYTFREPLSPHLAARRAGISLELRPILDAIRLFDNLDLDLVLIELAGGLFSPLNDKESNAHLALAIHQAALATAAAVPMIQQVAMTAESSGHSPDAPPAPDGPGSTSGTWTASAATTASTQAFPARSRAAGSPPAIAVETPWGAHTGTGPSTAGPDDSIPRVLLVAPDRIGVLHEIGASARAADALGLPLAGVVLVTPQHPDASTGLNGPEIPYVTPVPYLGTLRRVPIDVLATDLKLNGFLAKLFS